MFINSLKVLHTQVKARHKSLRVHVALVNRGHKCSVNFVARVRREAGIAVKTMHKFRQTTDSNRSMPVGEKGLGREFDPEEPGAHWVCGYHVPPAPTV